MRAPLRKRFRRARVGHYHSGAVSGPNDPNDAEDTNPAIAVPKRPTPAPPGQRPRGVPSSAAAAAFPTPSARTGFSVRPLPSRTSAAPPPLPPPPALPPMPAARVSAPPPLSRPSAPPVASAVVTSPGAAVAPTPEAPEPSRNTIPSGPPSIPPVSAAVEPDKPITGPISRTPERASVAPSLMIPKPAPGSAPSEARIGQIEVQLQATRAALGRASEDVAAAQRRADAAEATAASLAKVVEALRTQLTESRTALEARVGDALARADRPVALDAVLERLDRLDHGMGQARAGQATAQHELAEHARLFESRKARLESVEARLGRLESDARWTELHRAIERIDLRLSALEKTRADGTGDLTPLLERLNKLEEQAAAPRSAADKSGGEGLQRVKGIGPKYAKQLRELGITEPAQIAAWTDADLSAIADKLGVPKKRLEKLGWIEAARATL